MKKKLLSLIKFSYNEVEMMWRLGTIDEATWRAYKRIWTWSAPRFGGGPGLWHEAYWERYGKEAYYRKINRVRAAFGMADY